MKHHVKRIISNPLIYGSGIVVFGNLVANFFNFLFNLFMSRNLSLADYGTFATLISLVTFPALLVGSITPLVVRFAGDYFAQERLDLINGLYRKIAKISLLLAISLFIIFLLLIPELSSFLHIARTELLFVVDLIIFISVMSVMNIAFLQAKLAFAYQVSVNVVNAICKLVFGGLFVLLGFSIFGAISATFIAVTAAYLFSFFPLRSIFSNKSHSPTITTRELYEYGIPTALALLGLTSFISTDIILVKHFFTSEFAGFYAALSLASRVIFYVSAPIGSVMFPIIVRKHSKKENFTNTFMQSLLLVLLPSVFLVLLYFLFPQFILPFFTKKNLLLPVGQQLGYFSIFITFYSLLTIICNFYLSIKKTKIYLPVLLGAIAQIVLISLFHNSFVEVISISAIITFLLVTGLLLYYPYATKEQVQH